MNIRFHQKPIVTNHIISGSSPGNFLRVLRDNRFAVDRPFLPKLLKSLLIIIVSYPNYLLEKLIYQSKIKKTMVVSPVFILGYPRSGTTHLMYLMSKDKRFAFCHTYECLGPHTIFTFGRVLRFILKRALPKTRPMDNMALGAMLPKEEEFAIGNMGVESMAHALYFPKKFSEHFNRFVLFSGDIKEKINWKNNHLFLLKKLTLKNKGKRMVLKSPFDTGRVKEILELYPDAKFIHIYRNPYAVYFSNVKLYEGVLPQTAFHAIGNHEMEQHVFYTYKATYKKFIAEKPLIPRGNLFEISYEQFIGHEQESLENIYGMLNLGNFKDVLPEIQSELHKTKNYQINKYALSSEKENAVFENWQFAFDAFGYNKVLA